ncbi:site-specific integrase [Ectopseudomonas mendocina]|uniref:Site-specific integrase n=1 Tax=Ectopseudomonas mendocina TaxID=300 RepID=A0ABD7RZ32_ECTME|nr:tyrosine-type recombinase/integrase [Pseudomonas mendocina]TRO14356.1 site-specific integrase [Pseudomonas mendocina]TRO19407.1 site-specific integrase [Pseudomonas mendocina]
MASKKTSLRTVGDVVLWWLERLMADNERSSKYRGSMRSVMQKHVVPRAGKVLVRKVDRVTLDDRLIWPMHNEGLKPRTVQKAVQGLRQAFAMAEKGGHITTNPMAGITFRNFYSGKLRPKPAALSRIDLPALVRHLVEVFNDDPARGMLPLLMLAYGTRITETLLTRWARFSLDERVWFISAADQKSRREHLLPITPQIIGLVTRYRAALPEARLRAVWMFAVRGGNRMADTSAHALIREISERQWTSHDLRKLMRSSLSDIGIDYMVAEHLINHSLGTTAETYLSKDEMDRRRDAVERWHARLDECGFAAAHGVNVAVPALLQNSAKPLVAGDSADSCTSMGRG